MTIFTPQKFTPGMELSRLFYWKAVRPVLDAVFHRLPHGAALLGSGSEVLGFDTPMSMDHNWFPRVQIFLLEDNIGFEGNIRQALAEQLPHVFNGFPVDKVESIDEPGTHFMDFREDGLVEHGVTITTLRQYAWEWMAWDIDQPLRMVDWLSTPTQVLRSMVTGAVHHDGTGELSTFRSKLSWYPQDIWLYLMAAGWWRLGEEEHLMPRAGFVGDELGSRVIAARLVRGMMELCFLMEKVYAPYAKWFGTGFRQLVNANELAPWLEQLLASEDYHSRQAAYCAAAEILAGLHNRLELTAKQPVKASPFWGRPWDVIHGEVFSHALREIINDEEVACLASKGFVGNIDQVSDNTEAKNRAWRTGMREIYRIT